MWHSLIAPSRTCFYVLGLISSTPQGAEILSDYGWEATLSPLGLPTGLCVPLDLGKFLLVRGIQQYFLAFNSRFPLCRYHLGTLRRLGVVVTCASSPQSPRQRSRLPQRSRTSPTPSLPPQRRARLPSPYPNLVSTTFFADPIRRLKSRPEYQWVFSSVPMFYRALHMISTSRYRLPVRRYVFDLFDIDLDEDVLGQLGESARVLALPASEAVPSQPNSRVVSVLFAAPRTHASESDGEDEASHVPHHGPPVISLRPRSTVVGFRDE